MVELCLASSKIRAERRCGEMLKATAESGEWATKGAHKGNQHTGNVERCDISKLQTIGIQRAQSSRYQKLATIPEDTFEATLEEFAKKKGVPTTAGVMPSVDKSSYPQLRIHPR